MKTILFSLALVSLSSCRSTQGGSTSDVQSAGASAALASRLKHVSCVSEVKPERPLGTTAGVAPAATGNLAVVVKNVSQTVECAQSIHEQVPDAIILSVLENIGYVIVLADPKQLAVIEKVKKTDCAKSIELEFLQDGLGGGATEPQPTGNLIVIVKDNLSFSTCVSKLKASGVAVLDVTDGLKMVLIKGR